MAYQTKVITSYGTRLKNSAGGMKTGVILFIFGTVLLFLNEGNYVKNYKTIGDAKKALVRGTIDVSAVDPALEGKLIYAHEFADTQDVLSDDPFGVSEKAIALIRKVEYYQYEEKSQKESKDKLGGSEETTITYTYEKRWFSSPVNSGEFADPDYKGKNFVLANVKAQTQYAKNVSLGAYRLPSFMIEGISGSVPVEPRINNNELLEKLGVKAGTQVQTQGNVVYLGKSSSSPEIGDVRITLAKVDAPAEISIIAKVVGSTFEEFIAPSTGRTFSDMAMGTVSAETMFKRFLDLNKFLLWLLRIIGIILVVAGLKLLLGFLPTLLKILPILGKIVGVGIGLVCTVGGFAWSLVIISVAWLFYRPLIAIPMLAIAAGGIALLIRMKNKKKAEQAEKTSASDGR